MIHRDRFNLRSSKWFWCKVWRKPIEPAWVRRNHAPNTAIQRSFALFTVNFWAVLWHLAWWIDQNLIMSMYPDPSLFLILFSPAEQGTKLILLNMLTTATYLSLPLLWTAMMAWVGIKVGAGLEEMLGSTMRPAQGAGKIAQAIVTRIGRKAGL